MAPRSRDRPVLVWTLRLFLLLNLVSAVGFIVYALILENPPKTSLPLGLMIIGCISLASVLIGLIGTLRIACCLNIYLFLGVILTLAELGITLSMFFNYDNTVDDLWKYAKKSDPTLKNADKEALKQKVRDGRWFFLAVLILQVISVVAAVVLRMCIYPRERDFENFEEGSDNNSHANNSQIQMQKLQQSIGRNQPSGAATSPSTASYASTKLYKSTTQKMAAKYGDFTTEFKSKSFLSRMLGK